MDSVSREKTPPAKSEISNSPENALANLPILSNALSNTPTRVLTHGDPINASVDSLAYTLSQRRKYSLLALFAATIAVDVICGSGVFLFTGVITEDLDILPAQQSWVVTAYAVTFSSFLVFWGRVADLFAPKLIFCLGFLGVGICNLVISCLTDRYAFFIFRALAGVSAAAVVPTAYRLIGQVFPPEERSSAYTLYSMTGSIANVSGTIIAGFFGLIQRHDQMSAWRWFFRFVAIFAIPISIISFKFVPKSQHKAGATFSFKEKLARLDFAGIAILEIAVILLIMGLTFGASFGWKTAAFFCPFLISIALFPFFFWYETRIPITHALLPPAIWKLPNITVLVVFALITLGWWCVSFLAFIEVFLYVGGDSMIIAAVRTLPVGISAGIISVVCVICPKILSRPRWPIIICMVLCTAAYLLWSLAPSWIGADYWKYVVPGMIFGSPSMQVILLATNVGIMMSAPPEQAGTVGAMLNMSMQSSVVVAMSIQAGLLTVRPGGVTNQTNVRTSYFFEMGWCVVWLIGFIIFYNPKKTWDKTEKSVLSQLETGESSTTASTSIGAH